LKKNDICEDIHRITLADLSASNPLGDALLALNNAHEVELSRLTAARFQHLTAQAFAAWRIGAAEAFLIAFDQTADYDSPNFLWFRARFQNFVYVDRVAVAPQARGQGHARLLYEHLFASARLAGHQRIVCEVNTIPPNPESDSFHARLGFTEIGTGTIHEGQKTVRYLSKDLAPD
jgi:predicted GNAT superfamily acetyltransferase